MEEPPALVIECRILPMPKLAGIDYGFSLRACLKYLAAFLFSPVFARSVARWMQAPKFSWSRTKHCFRH